MSNNPQKFNGGEYVDKARDAARDNPDKARSAIDKVQEAANRRTGGKFGSLIDKAGDFVEDKLGLPEEKAAEDTTPAPKDAGAPAPKPQAPAPKQDSAPRESGQSDSTGGGVLPG
ncbi:hypothetical protein ASG73_08215 [Janibacter sp. Soil728]|uniref:antitoxin n=1 Tax=Janibacter sp. Soil728 TaxID=1736393 RepID=UPI0006F712AC|nr:antitoxin [Janibacter sp. Soil728]KRE37632.1 hypothetical protein ASG73_08215 [Janibacter sp. Soil728]